VKCAYTNQANTHQSALTCLKNNGDVAYLSLEIAQQFIEVKIFKKFKMKNTYFAT